MKDIYSKFKKHVFPNKLELYSFQAPDEDFEAVGFIVYAGFRQDPDGKEGVAHFIEHLVSDNCIVKDSEIHDFFRQHGGNCRLGSTDVIETTYEFSMLVDEDNDLRQAFSIFSSMLITADLKEWKKEKRRVANEVVRAYGSETDIEIFEEGSRTVCSGHPYFGKAILGAGTEKTFSTITDIDLKIFYDQYYVPANIAIVAYGAMTEEKLIEIISQTDFIAAKPGVRNPIPVKNFIPETPKNNLFFGKGTKDGGAKYWDCVSVAALPGQINPLAVCIFSRSLNEVLKKRIQNSELGIYRANTSWENHSDVHKFSVIVDAVPREKVDEILRSIDDSSLEVIADYQLFEKVKSYSIAACRFNDLNGRTLVSNVIGNLKLFQKIKTIEEVLDEFNKVCFADIQEIGKWLTPERRWTAFSKM
jgi:predicted Zn-dependent peptidase